MARTVPASSTDAKMDCKLTSLAAWCSSNWQFGCPNAQVLLRLFQRTHHFLHAFVGRGRVLGRQVLALKGQETGGYSIGIQHMASGLIIREIRFINMYMYICINVCIYIYISLCVCDVDPGLLNHGSVLFCSVLCPVHSRSKCGGTSPKNRFQGETSKKKNAWWDNLIKEQGWA